MVESPRDAKSVRNRSLLASCMVAPYNLDVTEISRYLAVSPSSVYRYITLFEQTGDVNQKSYRHGPPKLLGDMEQLFLLRVILILAFILARFVQNSFPNLVYPWT